jgi:hypothetical protein
LENAIVFCKVSSWITGCRLVSLPFSDHCDALVQSGYVQADILAHVRDHIDRERCKYAEIRPFAMEEPESAARSDLLPSERFVLHVLSLDQPIEKLFRGLHRDCIQRKVHRAEREGLSYEHGRSDAILRTFYQLLLKARRRQGLPPQPLQWFRNLISSVGDRLTIRVASKDSRPVAALLTLTFRDTVTYKYGCSDEKSNHLGGMPFLFWKTIQEAKDQGMRQLDLGRSDLDNLSLVRFKDRLGASRMTLQYYRVASRIAPRRFHYPRHAKLLRRLIGHIPDTLLVAAGRFLYRHIG